MTDETLGDSAEATVELFTVLDQQACARFLTASRYGRLAVVVAGRPRIVILNHVVDGEDVLFRTRATDLGAQLTADGAEVDAVFEVDSAFPLGGSGWSVMATGRLCRENDPAGVARALAGVQPWALGERGTVLRLRVAALTGRTVGPL